MFIGFFVNRLLLFFICFACFVASPLKSYCENVDKELVELFYLASEVGDVKLVNDVVQAIARQGNDNLLDALAKYSEKGKIDFALHNAIKDKNVIASILLAHHAKDVNTRKLVSEVVWTNQSGASKSGVSRPSKSPIELALDSDLIGLIPYFLGKKADIYVMNNLGFLYEGEEDPAYMEELGYPRQTRVGIENKERVIVFPMADFKRTLMGAAICKNRLDVIKMFQKISVDLNKTCCSLNGQDFTPLQFSLAIKRYEIAQFLIDHGARIE